MMPTRRLLIASLPLLPLAALCPAAVAQNRQVWSAQGAYRAVAAGEALLLDIRSRPEWRQTGVGQGAWPVSMHEPRFPPRLLAAHKLAGGRPVALICATGGRTASVMRALRQAGYSGYVDVSEGMFGSAAGPGWIAAGLPVVAMDQALSALPQALL